MKINNPIIGVVGPCKSGKTLLKKQLVKIGYQVRHIAQEHSFTPDMWKQIGKPDILIYLDVSYTATLRRSTLVWTEGEYREQTIRLSHARENADIYIDTSELSPNIILKIVLDYLQEREM